MSLIFMEWGILEEFHKIIPILYENEYIEKLM